MGVLLKVKRAAAAMASVAAVGGSIAVAALAEALAQAAERRKRGPLILRPGGRPIDPARARGQRSLRAARKGYGAVDPAPGWSAYRSGPGPWSTAPLGTRGRSNGSKRRRFGWQHWQQQGSSIGMRRLGKTAQMETVQISTSYILLGNAHE